MSAIFLYSDHRHVSVTHVAIFVYMYINFITGSQSATYICYEQDHTPKKFF